MLEPAASKLKLKTVANKEVSDGIVVAALYKFLLLDNYKAMRQPLLRTCMRLGIKGTLLLAAEGINGTVAGSRIAIDSLLAYLRSDERLKDLEHKESYTNQQPFYRTKIKLKKEIVTLGVHVDPNNIVGKYIVPEDWNDVISDPNVIVVDTRNDYEVEIGTFKNAINPKTDSFREFPEYVDKYLSQHKDKKIAMFCTGGIRCEKSTAYLLEQGFTDVCHLKGGILKYLEDIPPEQSMWQGECFVFDNRVAVTHDLKQGTYEQCHGCRFPITEQDMQSEHYKPGVHCPRCYQKLSPDQVSRFSERHKQVQLSKMRDEQHIGG